MLDELLAAATEPLPQRAGAHQLHEPLGQSTQISRLEQKTSFVFQANLSGAIAVIGNDRTRRSQRLCQGARQAFAPR